MPTATKMPRRRLRRALLGFGAAIGGLMCAGGAVAVIGGGHFLLVLLALGVGLAGGSLVLGAIEGERIFHSQLPSGGEPTLPPAQEGPSTG
jgi:hypothetical protein